MTQPALHTVETVKDQTGTKIGLRLRVDGGWLYDCRYSTHGGVRLAGFVPDSQPEFVL